jgi:hypothetical protein
MHTQCPHCLTVFEPTPYHLARGRGRLQCGVCEREFDALERLSAHPIHNAIEPVAAATPPPRIEPEHRPEQGHLFEAVRSESPSFVAPDYSAQHPRSNRTWWVGSVALGVLLSAQMVLAQRAELSRDPGWRPWLERLCEPLRCDLPSWRDPSALRLTARDVRPHPSVADALMITASFRNDAPWPQAWPVLQIAMSDLDGKPLAMRRFRVEEYLGAAPRDATLAPGQSASATIEVQDPGKQAVAFAFEFH